MDEEVYIDDDMYGLTRSNDDCDKNSLTVFEEDAILII